MDETLWCPGNPNSELSSIKRATKSLFDSAYNVVPGLKVGDPADINDTIVVGPCANNLYQSGKKATVKVRGDLDGSGFFISDDGLVATAAHIVPPPGNTVLIDDTRGNTFAARVKIEDQINDIAILKVIEARPDPTPFDFLPLRDEPLKPSEPVAAFGHPKSWDKVYISPGVNTGNLTSYERTATKDWKLANEITAIHNHVELGNSGGPLVDNAGRAVGLVVGRYTNRADLSLVVTTPAIKTALTNARFKIGIDEGGWGHQTNTQMAHAESRQPSAIESAENYYAKRIAPGVSSAAGSLSTALSTWGNSAKTLLNVGIAVTKVPTFAFPLTIKPGF